ncbi:MAG: hypothetical protein O2931_10510 [Planctomycetota bacterium]|nr:hypothetical protein [Planctomycetota bacterium]MDA1179214.1 hypothetical protein [Planctomycetota bacterium]
MANNRLLTILRTGCLLLPLQVGCHRELAPSLEFSDVKYWSMPSVDHKVPAPRSLTIHGDEVYVLDTAGRVLVFDGSGTVVRSWYMPAYDVGRPEDIHVLKDGRIAVADTHYHRVVFFDTAGNVQGMLGEFGKGPGQFIYPVALTEDDQGNLFVGEYGGNDRVQKFSPSGEVLANFGRFGTQEGEFQRPSGLAWSAGNVFVADAINCRIHVFRDDGTYLNQLVGVKQLAGRPEADSLEYPYDVELDGKGSLFVVEYRGGCVTQLTQAGVLVGRWGTTGTGDAHFSTPWGLAVDANRILVADTGNRRIAELRR